MSRSAAVTPAGASGRATDRATARQRFVAGAVSGASWLACRLPEGLLHELTDLVGELWYRLDSTRAAQARRNLQRVAGYLAEVGLADARTRAAASDPKALERLVRSAFRNYARYYLDVARAPALTPTYLAERLTVETPESFEAAFGSPGPRIFLGLHFGAIELQAYVAAVHAEGPLTTPMETIDDPALQAYFVRTRGALGIRHRRPARGAPRDHGRAAAGEPVGIVGDRDLTGGGMPVRMFGAATSLPLGPALARDRERRTRRSGSSVRRDRTVATSGGSTR